MFTFAPWVIAAIAVLGGLLLIRRLARGRRRRPIAAAVAGLVAVLFAAAPYLLGFDHRLLRLWMPDLGWSLLAGATVYGALAVALLMRSRHNEAMPSTDTAPAQTTRANEFVR